MFGNVTAVSLGATDSPGVTECNGFTWALDVLMCHLHVDFKGAGSCTLEASGDVIMNGTLLSYFPDGAANAAMALWVTLMLG
jgi:hypothetical protein